MLVCSYDVDQRTPILHVRVRPTRTIPLAEEQLQDAAETGIFLRWD
jgi:hypothetical protein